MSIALLGESLGLAIVPIAAELELSRLRPHQMLQCDEALCFHRSEHYHECAHRFRCWRILLVVVV